jgi:hypothetical protein
MQEQEEEAGLAPRISFLTSITREKLKGLWKLNFFRLPEILQSQHYHGFILFVKFDRKLTFENIHMELKLRENFAVHGPFKKKGPFHCLFSKNKIPQKPVTWRMSMAIGANGRGLRISTCGSANQSNCGKGLNCTLSHNQAALALSLSPSHPLTHSHTHTLSHTHAHTHTSGSERKSDGGKGIKLLTLFLYSRYSASEP